MTNQEIKEHLMAIFVAVLISDDRRKIMDYILMVHKQLDK
jgi:hypothetical protein